MPIIKSAIKAMKQNRTHQVRNRHYGSHMKSMIKLILGYVQKGEMEKAKKILPEVIRAIDMAAKKGIIHKNNAANKKSRVQGALNAGPQKKEEKASKVAAKAEKEAKAAKEEKMKEEAKKSAAADKAEKKTSKKAEKKEKKA